jgi:hypothetical protein
MDAFLTLLPEERRQICLVAAEQLNLNPGGVEKDFWVCWTLRELFSLPEIGQHLTFKGGTSLSKGWKLIQRFSEDIDVVIDRDVLGFDGERSPEVAAGSNERRRRLEALRTACQTWIRDALHPALDRRLRERLGGMGAWTLTNDPNDPDRQTLLFSYPGSIQEQGYLRPEVKIELGARSDVEPSARPEIQPYIADALPDVLGPSQFAVQTLDPRRTFLEKACLLHEESYRAGGKAPAARLSRHYYDLWCLIRAGTADAAVADPELFNRVVAHRGVFFRRSAEAQATLRPGSLRIMPTREHYPAWQRDYDAMREAMFFGEAPEFAEILMAVEDFQNKFNKVEAV